MGAWSVAGLTPTGAVLWVLWGAEALLILAPAALVPLGVLSVPFCERCDLWCEPSQDVARFTDCDATELKRRAETEGPDFLDWLKALGAPSLHDCLSCGNLHTLTLKAVRIWPGDDRENMESEREIVNQLVLSTEEAHRLRSLAAASIPA